MLQWINKLLACVQTRPLPSSKREEVAGTDTQTPPYKQEPIAKTTPTPKRGRPNSLPLYRYQNYFSIYLAEGCVKESYISKSKVKIQTREQDMFEDAVGGVCIYPPTNSIRSKYAVREIKNYYGDLEKSAKEVGQSYEPATENPHFTLKITSRVGQDYELTTTARDHYLMIRSGRRDFLVALIETYLASFHGLKKQRAVGSIMLFANAVVFLTPFKYSYRGDLNTNEIDSLLSSALYEAEFHWLSKGYIQSLYSPGKMQELSFGTKISHPRSPSFTCDTPRAMLESALKGYLSRVVSRLLERGDYDYADSLLASLNKLHTETRAVVDGHLALESTLKSFIATWHKKLFKKQVKPAETAKETEEEGEWKYSLILMKNCLNLNYISNTKAKVTHRRGTRVRKKDGGISARVTLNSLVSKRAVEDMSDILDKKSGKYIGFIHEISNCSDTHYLVVKHENMIGQEQVTNILKGLFFNPKLSKLEYSTDFGNILVFPNATVLLSDKVTSTSIGERALIAELKEHSFRIYDNGLHWISKSYIDKLLEDQGGYSMSTNGYHYHVGHEQFRADLPEYLLHIGCQGYFTRAVSYYLEKNDITSADAVINTLQTIVKEHGHALSNTAVKMVEAELSTLLGMRRKELRSISKKKEMQ